MATGDKKPVVMESDLNRERAAWDASVRYDTAQSLSTAQQAHARGNIGAAPGGYGLGNIPKKITDWDQANVCGWYYSEAGADNAPEPTTDCFGRVDNEGSPAVFVQDVWGLANIGRYYHWRRMVYQVSGQGTPWEWVDPPMYIAIEYRTTERYKGLPVYKKLDTDGAIKWRIDGETEWKPEVAYTGAASILTVSVPSRNITVAASELTAYLNAMPRLVTEQMIITVTAGVETRPVDLSRFYGPGRMRIIADGDVTLSGGVFSYYNKLFISLEGNFFITGELSYEKCAVYAYHTDQIFFQNCTLTAADSSNDCIICDNAGFVSLNLGSIRGYNRAALVRSCSKVSLANVAASGNTIGVHISTTGSVFLGGSTPNTVGGSTNIKDGGIIVKQNGTLL